MAGIQQSNFPPSDLTQALQGLQAADGTRRMQALVQLAALADPAAIGPLVEMAKHDPEAPLRQQAAELARQLSEKIGPSRRDPYGQFRI